MSSRKAIPIKILPKATYCCAFWSKIIVKDYVVAAYLGNYFCPYRTYVYMLHQVRRVLPWAKEAIGPSARCCLYIKSCEESKKTSV